MDRHSMETTSDAAGRQHRKQGKVPKTPQKKRTRKAPVKRSPALPGIHVEHAAAAATAAVDEQPVDNKTAVKAHQTVTAILEGTLGDILEREAEETRVSPSPSVFSFVSDITFPGDDEGVDSSLQIVAQRIAQVFSDLERHREDSRQEVPKSAAEIKLERYLQHLQRGWKDLQDSIPHLLPPTLHPLIRQQKAALLEEEMDDLCAKIKMAEWRASVMRSNAILGRKIELLMEKVCLMETLLTTVDKINC